MSAGPEGSVPCRQVVAPSWAPRWLQRAATVLGALYLAAIWMEAAGMHAALRALPLPARFFVQVAELFPHAAPDAIEWRALAWRCALGRFEELDVRPFFPIRRDDKESRFHRAMFFHYRQPRVLGALDDFITRAQNRLHPEARIGGVMLLSLRIPIPPLGARVPRYQRLAVAAYPAEVARKYWYATDPDARERRCAERP
jgi:hypothetical protein